MNPLIEVKPYLYIDDRNDVWVVRIRVCTAQSGGFEAYTLGEIRLPDFPMPNGYMRRMSVKIPGTSKPLMIPVAEKFFAAYRNGGTCNVVTPDGAVQGKVINTFGERWDHNLFRLDTELI